MSNFSLSHTSKNKLQGVNPLLINIVNMAIDITDVDFLVIEGVRDIQRQRQMY